MSKGLRGGESFCDKTSSGQSHGWLLLLTLGKYINGVVNVDRYNL